MADLTLSTPSYTPVTGFGHALTGGNGTVANPFATNGTWTVAGWVRDVARGAVRVAVGAIGTCWFGCDGSNNATARYGTSGSGEVSLTTSVPIMDDARHHFALVAGPSGVRLYVDGTLAASSATTASGAGATYTNTFGIRTFPGAESFDWQGHVDEIGVWNIERYTSNFSVPTAPYANSDSGLVSLWHLDQNGVDSATGGGGGVTPIAPDNAGILYSPYNWHVNSTRAQTVNPGAHLRTLFTGPSCVLNFDMTNVSSPVGRVHIRVDGRTNQSASLASTISVTMPSGQDNTTHLLEVTLDATSETLNRWNDPPNAACKFAGLTLATAEDTVSVPQRRPLNILVYGDSITEGVRTLALDGSADVDRNSALVCWPLELGRQLGAEVGVVGFGFQGISNAGNGNVPNLRNAWDLLWAGQARTFTPAPDYCIWLQGHNDGGNNTQTDGIAALDGMLTAMPSTQFVLFRPLAAATQEANLQAIAAGCSDPSRVRYISTAGFWQASEASDSVHPYGWADMANIAPKMADAILTPATRTTRTVTVTLTSDGTTPIPNLPAQRWAFFDSPHLQSLGAPASQGSGEVPNATTAVLTLSVETTLPSGGTGWLVVGESNGTAGVQHSGFSGPVTVS